MDTPAAATTETTASGERLPDADFREDGVTAFAGVFTRKN